MRCEDELTTRRAAEFLGVSETHAARLLEGGAMPSRDGDGRRVVRLSDLAAYRDAWHAKRHAALDELAALSQDLDMGY